MDRDNILEVKQLSAGYEGLRVVRDVSFSLKEGEIMGIVGESGCGKSTLLKAISRLPGLQTDILSGQVLYRGRNLAEETEERMRLVRGAEISMVFQNAESSLNPSRKIFRQIRESIRAHRNMSDSEIRMLADRIFHSVGLHDVDRIIQAYPFELSGGMAQRVAIALAILLEPRLLLADEPTSALDTTIQKQVIEELMALRDQYGTSILIIAHNMGVIRHIADTIGVMYGGRMVEYGRAEEVLDHPGHPYTRALLAAVPRLGGELPRGLAGRPPHFSELGEGCAFASRCPYVLPECQEEESRVFRLSETHHVLCRCSSSFEGVYGKGEKVTV